MKPNPSSHNSDGRDADDGRIRAAAEWRSRQDAGLTELEQAEFARWLEADSRHKELFAQMDATWEILDQVGEVSAEALRPVPGAFVVPVIRMQADRMRTWATALAAAAAIALSGTIWLRHSPRIGSENFRGTVAVAADGMKRMNLPDGSVIRMNSGAEVVVNFTAALRAVRLVRGEAYFEVAKNKARPFVVTAGSTAVRAVGTAFDVAINAARLEVFVTEGKVTIDRTSAASNNTPPSTFPAPGVPLLQAGEKLALGPAPESAPVVTTVAPEEMEQALAWRARRLNFESTSLAVILAEFNRYNAHQLVLAPEAAELGRQRFGGSFRADDPETFLEMLKTRANVTVEAGSQQTVVQLRVGH